MTIERRVKYVASDGTEHDSPQAAAEHNLVMTLARLKDMPAWSLTELTIKALARNPEALRDALDAYFEALEAHPDVDDFGADPAYFYDPEVLREMARDGILTEAAEEEIHRGTFCDKPLSPRSVGDPDDPSTWRVELHEGEIAPGVRGFEMEVPSYRGTCDGDHSSPACADPECWHKAIHFQGGEVTYKSADRLTVDHPQYCCPFGTRED